MGVYNEVRSYNCFILFEEHGRDKSWDKDGVVACYTVFLTKERKDGYDGKADA